MEKRSVIIGVHDRIPTFWGPDEREQLRALVDLHPQDMSREAFLADEALLAETRFIFGIWGMPTLDEKTLARMPALEAVFYAAGSVRGFVTDAFWRRGIHLTSSYAYNAIAVAEYCTGAILLSLKNVFRHFRLSVKNQRWHGNRAIPMPGAYHSKVGLISLGKIGRKTAELLRAFDLEILVYDIHLSEAQADEIGVQRASLEEIFSNCEVVSLHTALLPETRGMITGNHLRAMKPYATFINTSRGAVVRQKELVEVMRERPDLTAILDVLDPEPPEDGHPLFALPNVFISPHISGSQGRECRRMGQHAIDECRRFLNQEPLQSRITAENFRTMA